MMQLEKMEEKFSHKNHSRILSKFRSLYSRDDVLNLVAVCQGYDLKNGVT
jgi:hypothetical protein